MRTEMSNPTDTVIDVRKLRKSYGQLEAVRGIDFSVRRGEVLALLGPNGAGKTTTVEILEGYRTRSSGEVTVLGTDPARRERSFRSKVGIVLQECAVDPFLTVMEVLTQRAGLYPSPRPVAEVLALAGLASKERSRVKTLSGGQQRRLDLALALVGNPELIFLDEPTTGFDPSARRESWEVVRGLCAEGRTVVLTTHYMDEAQALADTVVVIAGGTVVASGSPDTLGGRDHGRTTIRFTLPAGTSVGDLPLPPDAVETVIHDVVELRSDEPTGLLHDLTGWAVARGSTLAGLTVDRPTLEDVYLSLVGDGVADGARGSQAAPVDPGPGGSEADDSKTDDSKTDGSKTDGSKADGSGAGR